MPGMVASSGEALMAADMCLFHNASNLLPSSTVSASASARVGSSRVSMPTYYWENVRGRMGLLPVSHLISMSCQPNVSQNASSVSCHVMSCDIMSERKEAAMYVNVTIITRALANSTA